MICGICPSAFSYFSALQSLDIHSSCEFHVENYRIPKEALSDLTALSLHDCHSSLYEVLIQMKFVFPHIRTIAF